MTQPKTNELQTMSVLDLVIKLIIDSGSAVHYRKHILLKSATQPDKTLREFLSESLSANIISQQENNPVIDQLNHSEFVTRVSERKNNFKEACAVLRDESTFIDPRGAMRMHVDAARDFITSLLERDQSYEDLTPNQSNTFWMICDAFRREKGWAPYEKAQI
jgi:hypothetical protein